MRGTVTVDGLGPIRLGLRAVDRGVGGGVDQHLGVMPVERPGNGVGPGDVQRAVRQGVIGLTQTPGDLAPHLPAGTEHQNAHGSRS